MVEVTPDAVLAPGRQAGQAARDRFVAACAAYGERAKADAREAIRRSEERLAGLSAELRAGWRELHAQRKRLAALEAVEAADSGVFAADFDQFTALSGVHLVEVRGSRVEFTTDEIVIAHGGRRYGLGAFRVTMDLENGISIAGETPPPVAEWPHPHVQGGKPCLGALAVGVEKLLAECSVAPLAVILVQFLKSYDPDTAYCAVERWMEVG